MRQKRADIIDSLDTTEEELLGLLSKVSDAIEPFASGGESGEFEPYSPTRVDAARYHLRTAQMHVSALFNEIPHNPRSHRAPEPPPVDEE